MINSIVLIGKTQFSMLRKSALYLILFIGIFVNAQYKIPPKPTSDFSLVFNYSAAQVLSADEQQALNRRLIDYEAQTSTQIALVIIGSLKDEDPNLLAAQWSHKWGIGQKGKDNGMMILMSSGDRKIAIQNGYGLEEFMTDARSRQVISNIIIPEFKKGDYYKGFDKGLDAIFDILDGKFVEDGKNQESDNMSGFIMLLFFFGFLLLIILLISKGGGNNNDKYGSGKRRNPFGDVIFTDFGKSVWSDRSGGFGSGGFGGFGGGGFGGGGASGSW